MSALDDAYVAGAKANFDPATWDDLDDMERNMELAQACQSINAFLAHLADNPPEGMVKAAFDVGCAHPRFHLSAALRSLGSNP